MAIISFSHEFVFIKNLKTAGTSIEVHLSQQCCDTDIVTPIDPPNPTHHPRNFVDSAGRSLFYNHMSARRIRELIPDDFGRFFKFCFERHPVDKCLSHYAMLINSPRHRPEKGIRSWQDYLERGEFPVDAARYTSEAGELLVDKIYKYEELAGSLTAISATIGLQDRPLSVREKGDLRYGVPSVAEVMARPSECRLIFDAFASSLRFVDYC